MEAITLKILKVFNNNSVAAISDELGDIILTGSGIGFQKRIGDEVDESRIEKTYFFKDDQQKRFEQSIETVPAIYFEITNKIVNQANKELDTDFSGEIFLAISDHISFAVKRKKEEITFAKSKVQFTNDGKEWKDLDGTIYNLPNEVVLEDLELQNVKGIRMIATEAKSNTGDDVVIGSFLVLGMLSIAGLWLYRKKENC